MDPGADHRRSCSSWLLLALVAPAPAVAAWAVADQLVPVFLYVDQANALGVAVLLVASCCVVGDQIRRRRQQPGGPLAEQAELSELEQARRAVLEERTRIAREMHDVVAHHMSMIAVQAETAPYRLDRRCPSRPGPSSPPIAGVGPRRR